jgi:hypothetical protein
MLIICNYQNIVSLRLSDEADTGSGGDQPARNNLTDWIGTRGKYTISPESNFLSSQSNRPCLRKRFASKRSKREITIINPKKGQRIPGQDTTARCARGF